MNRGGCGDVQTREIWHWVQNHNPRYQFQLLHARHEARQIPCTRFFYNRVLVLIRTKNEFSVRSLPGPLRLETKKAI